MEFLKELWEIIKEHKGVVAFFGFFILIGVFGGGGSFADKIIYLLILLGMIAFFFFGNWVNWFPEKEDEIPPYQPRESVKTILTDEKIDELDRRYKENQQIEKIRDRKREELSIKENQEWMDGFTNPIIKRKREELSQENFQKWLDNKEDE